MASERSEGEGRDERAGRLGFIAHEVRNPLSTALWSAELLQRMSADDRGGARGEKMVAMVLRALGRVRQLVEDHFLTERLDVGGISIVPEPLDLGAVVEAAVGRKAPDVGTVSAEGCGGVAVLADHALLDRALDAIVGAAGREGAAVSIAVRAEGERRVLRVLGAPVAEGALSDPSKSSASDAKGRALALPLARRIAAVLGGELRVAGGALEISLRAADGARPVVG